MDRLFVGMTHFEALLFFALIVSVAFGFLSRRTVIERVKYIVWTFLVFVLVAVGIGWLMYPFSR